MLLNVLSLQVELLLEAFGLADFFVQIGMLRMLRVARIMRRLAFSVYRLANPTANAHTQSALKMFLGICTV